jgi:hypothetical protein
MLQRHESERTDLMPFKSMMKTRRARKAKRQNEPAITQQTGEQIQTALAKAERELEIGKRRARRKARRRVRAVAAVVKAKVRRGKRQRVRAAKKVVRRARIAKARTRRTRAS